eukprot:CAMPEP_0113908472 /NCGR_PEP_ID=MMETSP0780_2-20120614/26181_1 /TAXON_ID=652834 /ORGANISM="Palpitomonas bilix" /LENGTH=65 /DNA_ID=CAMNT_0000903905 /DNA_START=1 /DNA_END=194 /DNA_ORIENTATION=- /assembly_acc=CAM_ASM_000599
MTPFQKFAVEEVLKAGFGAFFGIMLQVAMRAGVAAATSLNKWQNHLYIEEHDNSLTLKVSVLMLA